MYKSETFPAAGETFPQSPEFFVPMSLSILTGSVEVISKIESCGTPSCCRSIIFLDLAAISIVWDEKISPFEIALI